MDNTATFEAYMLFRQTEAEHVANSARARYAVFGERAQTTPTSDTQWVYASANTEYEAFLMGAYDASLKTNSAGW